MSRKTPPHQPSTAQSRLFGLRIENQLIQLAIAQSIGEGRYRLSIDQIECVDEAGWLNAGATQSLREAFAVLVDRHDIRRCPVAVSLDGDYCVARIAMGTTVDVDRELKMLDARVPRYLQLGPGEKATGQSRTRINPQVEHAVTGVVNRSLIEDLYEALRSTGLEIAWVEPSLVSLARLVGHSGIAETRPVLIADGTGQQWDVGITCAGRLLLHYRPATATNEKSFLGALKAHFSRLRRFCERHRGIASGDLDQLLLCGGGAKLDRAVEAFEESDKIQASRFLVPEIPELYEIEAHHRDASYVAAVAAVLPLMIGASRENIPDLLETVRRAPQLSGFSRFLRDGWPAIAAAIFLGVSFGLVSHRRRSAESHLQDRVTVQARVAAAQTRMADMARQRELIEHFQRIADKTRQPEWDVLFRQITQNLPDQAKLNEFQVEQNGQLRLLGTVLEESLVYDVIGNLRRIPHVTQVALQGTSPAKESAGSQFVVHLNTASKPPNPPQEPSHE